MNNPWLDISLSDYEAHMALPEVAQARLLADVFSAQLEIHKPGSLAVLGCAGGNGFERIKPDITRRVVGVELNGSYLQAVRVRFGNVFEELELIEGDIQVAEAAFAPVDLIYAALVLEYVEVRTAVTQACASLNPRGVLVTVVQLPDAKLPAVTPSPFPSMKTLEAAMHFASPMELRIYANANGLRQIASATRQTPSGKQFRVQVFRAP